MKKFSYRFAIKVLSIFCCWVSKPNLLWRFKPHFNCKSALFILLLFFVCAKVCLADDDGFMQTYYNMEVPTFSYVHGIDPGEYYDNKPYTWTPYPLFRLSSTLYFKNIVIPPSYYALTPRAYQGKDYVLFKEYGRVKYIIPVYKKEFVPEGFYDSHLPKPKMKLSQKINKSVMTWIGKHCKRSQRREIPKSYIEVNDLDNKFVSIVVYYGPYMYYMIFRTIGL